MKHVWVIDEKEYNLFEGYVMSDYKVSKHTLVFSSENANDIIGSFAIENIFEDKLTALNIFDGIINIERKRIWREIDKLNRKNEILSEKLLNIHNL